jgi:Zn-dependent protease
MPGSIRLFRIAGIDIDINLSWLVILVLLTVSLATTWFPLALPHLSGGAYWLIGLIASVLLFVSVLLHELAHSLVAKLRGLPVSSITLFIFGGVSNLEQEPQSAGVEFQMAFVGPLTSLVIGAIAFYLGAVLMSSTRITSAILVYLGITNIALGVFNLIPGFPLDGGRVLRSIIWGITGNLRTATRWAAGVGQFVAYLFILWGLLLFFGPGHDFLNGLWIGFIGWFLLNAAHSANSQVALNGMLRGVSVGNAMRPVNFSIPPNISLQHLVDEFILPYGTRTLPVAQDGQFVGLITLADIRQVPRDQWAQTPVSSRLVPVSRLHSVTPQQRLNDVLPLLAGKDINQVPVVQDGRLVGILSREDVIHYLEVRRSLGMRPGEPGQNGNRPPAGAQPPQQTPQHVHP